MENNPQVPSFLGKDGSYHYTWLILLHIIIPDNSLSGFVLALRVFCNILNHVQLKWSSQEKTEDYRTAFELPQKELQLTLTQSIAQMQFCFMSTLIRLPLFNQVSSNWTAITSLLLFTMNFFGNIQPHLRDTGYSQWASKPLRSQHVPKAGTQFQLSGNFWPVSVLRAAIPLCNLNIYLVSAVYKIQWEEKNSFSRLCLLEWHSSLYKRWNFQWERKDKALSVSKLHLAGWGLQTSTMKNSKNNWHENIQFCHNS